VKIGAEFSGYAVGFRMKKYFPALPMQAKGIEHSIPFFVCQN
jgi:hypothetical protein